MKFGSGDENIRGLDDQISLPDILRFLKCSYKTIVITGVLGLASAICYLLITPNKYEAVAQIEVAQLGIAQSGNYNPLGTNIEDPSQLIFRLSQPTSFTPQVIDICKASSYPGLNPGVALTKSIKLDRPKGAPNVIELRAFGSSPQEAESCAQVIFEYIKSTQSQILGVYIEDAKKRLEEDELLLSKAKGLAVQADKSNSTMGVVYLSTKDEIRFLLDEIAILKYMVNSNQRRLTRLIVPIYASDIPIAPKKIVVLVGGLFGGLFLGLLIALVLQMIAKLKITWVRVCNDQSSKSGLG